MFVPLYDSNPLSFVRLQYVTIALIIVNTAIFMLQVFGAPDAVESSAFGYGMIPAVLFEHSALAEGIAGVPQEVTLLTYMFLHGSWMHLLGNMLFLWVFGDNVEDATGHVRFLILYLICGAAAGLAHAYITPTSPQPLVGASGAVAGIIAAYVMLHPRVKVWVLVMWRIPLRISAGWAIGFWIVLQVFSAVTQAEDNIAWWAHIGGLAAGAILIPFFKRRDVPLFDKNLVHMKQAEPPN